MRVFRFLGSVSFFSNGKPLNQNRRFLLLASPELSASAFFLSSLYFYPLLIKSKQYGNIYEKKSYMKFDSFLDFSPLTGMFWI